MRKLFLTALGLSAMAVPAMAAPLNVCDFENCAIGDTFTVWNNYGDTSETTAVVEVDPADSCNKVLHVTLKGWNDYIEFPLDESLAGSALTDTYTVLQVRIYRHANDPCEEWKHFAIWQGGDIIYEDDGWPSQGPKATWMTKTYNLAAPTAGNTSAILRLGYNSENTDYYIDDVKLLHDIYDIYTYPENGELNFSDPNSTDKSYTRYSTPLEVPAGKELNVYTSRYTYWTSDMTGEGTLNIHGGGERTYLSNEKGAVIPDWGTFTGEVNIYPWPEVNPNVKAGFYGLILGHGNKKFDFNNIEQSIARRQVTNILDNNHVIVRAGATLAAESSGNARAYRIGTLTTEPGSQLMGYYKNTAYRAYYLVGNSNTDSELAGDIVPPGEKAKMGIIKEGAGTYTITSNNNNINGSLSILSGKVLIANDVETARAEKLRGAVGTALGSESAVVVYPKGGLGGTGHISGVTDLFGFLEPGGGKPGTLTFADFVNGSAVDLKVRPTSRLRMRVESAGSHDMAVISGAVDYYNINLALQPSTQMPVIEIVADESHNLKEGDRITLLKAAGKHALDGVEWSFRIQYPKVCTWKVEESFDNGYELTAVVTSLSYSGQGDEPVVTDPEEDTNTRNYYVDYTPDFYDENPLRHYAGLAGKRIGVAATAYRYNISDSNDPNVKTIGREFNMIEAENEMKMDATEPSRNSFSFYNGDKIVKVAEDNGMYVRGHTLVWHSQCPAWVTKDGYANDKGWDRETLISIMKNHIRNVLEHYKGRVHEWDVVNEMLDDDQSVVRGNPDAFNLRGSVWRNVIGDDYIEIALRYAKEIDPDIKLFINEYGGEFQGDLKSEAYYNLAKSLVGKGVPLDGVGLQCHLTCGQVSISRLASNIARYKDLGLEVVVTELDLSQSDNGELSPSEAQAVEYGAIVNAALSQSNCTGVLIWGLADKDSWRGGSPLIFDDNLNKKEAYYAVHAALRVQDADTAVGEIAAEMEAEVVSTEYYDINGRRADTGVKGILIRIDYLSNGEVLRTKILNR